MKKSNFLFLTQNSLLKVFESTYDLPLLRVHQRQHVMRKYLLSKLRAHSQLQLLHFIFQLKGD